jgi:hypothetical protein
MANKQLADWQKITIMATAPFRGNRSVAKKAECSVWSVRKYRNEMKDRGQMLDVGQTDDYENAIVSEEGMDVLDEIVEEGLAQERGRI